MVDGVKGRMIDNQLRNSHSGEVYSSDVVQSIPPKGKALPYEQYMTLHAHAADHQEFLAGVI